MDAVPSATRGDVKHRPTVLAGHSQVAFLMSRHRRARYSRVDGTWCFVFLPEDVTQMKTRASHPIRRESRWQRRMLLLIPTHRCYRCISIECRSESPDQRPPDCTVHCSAPGSLTVGIGWRLRPLFQLPPEIAPPELSHHSSIPHAHAL